MCPECSDSIVVSSQLQKHQAKISLSNKSFRVLQIGGGVEILFKFLKFNRSFVYPQHEVIGGIFTNFAVKIGNTDSCLNF